MAALEASHASRAARHSVAGMPADDADGGPWAALRSFLSRRREWSVVAYDEASGVLQLSREPEDKPTMPSAASQAWNYAGFLARKFFKGKKLVPLDVLEGRLSHCWICPARADSRCSACGCHLDVDEDGGPGKARYAFEHCPRGFW